MRRKQAQEIGGVASHHGVFAKSDPCRAAGKQAGTIDDLEVLTVGAVGSHARHNADTQAHTNVGLDNVCIASRERHFRFQALFSKGALQRGLSAETEYVRNQRVSGEILQRQRPTKPTEIVPFRHNY